MKSIAAKEKIKTFDAAVPAIRGAVITFLFSVALVLAKQIMAEHGIGIPGSSGWYWMGLLILNRYYGMGSTAGTAMGFSSGILSLLFFAPGLGFGAGMGLVFKYAVSGVVIDIFYRKYENKLATAAAWAGAGAMANASKHVVNAAAKSITGAPSAMLIFGKWNALATHILFGLMGGLVAFSIVYAAGKLADKKKAA